MKEIPVILLCEEDLNSLRKHKLLFAKFDRFAHPIGRALREVKDMDIAIAFSTKDRIIEFNRMKERGEFGRSKGLED